MIKRIKLYLRTLGWYGLLALINATVRNSTVMYRIKRGNCAFPFQIRIHSSDVSAYEQIFIRQEYDFITKTTPGVIVDAGANIGLASIYFANKYPDTRIIAIEPEKSNYLILKKNVEPYSNVTPVFAALWHTNEEINLIDPGMGKWGFMTEESDSVESIQGEFCHRVKAITVDELIHTYNLEKIDVLKIDIEGAEKEVFSNTSSWIDKVESIIIELHERMKTGCNRSFYCGSDGFDNEWTQGENVYLSRKNFLTRRAG
ncbi:MAG: FkbM family methyltransferase [Chlorobiales bacterium]|nr:FkbM family methyltransferase [Chlorobiales bacterium]